MWGGGDSPSSFLDPFALKLEVPLVDFNQISKFVYFHGTHNGTVKDCSIQLGEHIQNKRVDRNDVWVGYDKFGGKKAKSLVTVPYAAIMDDPEACQVLLAYFDNYGWCAEHIPKDKIVSKFACGVLANLLRDGNYKGVVLKQQLSWQDDVEEEEKPTLKDLKCPSQILRLEYWHGNDLLITDIDILDQMIAEKKVRATDVWVVYAPVGSENIDTTPWEGIVSDNTGHILKAYVEDLILTAEDMVVKKACETVLHCLANESLCAELVAEHHIKYPPQDQVITFELLHVSAILDCKNAHQTLLQ